MLFKIISYVVFLSYMTMGNILVLTFFKLLDPGMLTATLSMLLVLTFDAILWMNFKVYGE
jgi:hypothetical protein